jgi:DNA end-binding protein Ku
MARSMWTGAISFGLVTIPVKLYSATQSHTISFNQFAKDSGERIRYKRVAEGSGKEVSYEDIVKGHEIDDGRFVIVTPEELASVEPTKSRRIDIEDFVDLDDIDPVYWNKTYYLGPAGDLGAEKPYALLLEAMRKANKVGIGKFVMREKEYLVTIRPLGDMLALETMFFADEVRSADEIDNAPVSEEVSDKELAMATQLIDALATEWDPTKYEDTYRERVEELLAAKAKGEDVVVADEVETPQVADLMEALKASVEASKKGTVARPGTTSDDTDDTADGAKGDGDLAKLSKDELYERATAADVPGRSKMTKDQLVDALTAKAS